MEPTSRVSVPLRTGKKMKKRKELDALVAHTVNKRANGGVSSHEQLLTDSSDEWTGDASGKSVQTLRRRDTKSSMRICATLARSCSAFLLLTSFLSSTGLLWLFLDVRLQVTTLRTELTQVVATHRTVPDELQEVHDLTRNLQKNQTQILERLKQFEQLLSNLTLNTTDVQRSLAAVQIQLKTSPNYAADPNLMSTVASFGSQVQDLNTTVARLKSQATSVEALNQNLIANLTGLAERVAGLETSTKEAGSAAITLKQFESEKSAILGIVEGVAMNLTLVNDTLTSKQQWTTGDQARDHKAIESLQEMNQNVTTRLSTLEGICSAAKQPPAGAMNSSGTQTVPPTDPISESQALLNPSRSGM